MRRLGWMAALLLWAPGAFAETPYHLYGVGSLGYNDLRYGLGGDTSSYRSTDESLNAHLESLLGDGDRPWLFWNGGGTVLHSGLRGTGGKNDEVDWGYDATGRLFPDRPYPLTLFARRDVARRTAGYFPPQSLINDAYGGTWNLGGSGADLPHLRLRGDWRKTGSDLATIDLDQKRAGLDLYRSSPGLSFAGNVSYDDWLDRLSGYRQTLRSLYLDESGRLADRTSLYAVGGLWDLEAQGRKSTMGNLVARLVHFPRSEFQGTALYALDFSDADPYRAVSHRGELGGDALLGSGLRARERIGLGRSEISGAPATSAADSLSTSTGVTLERGLRSALTFASYDFTLARSVGRGGPPSPLTPAGLGYAATSDGGSTVLSHRLEGALQHVLSGPLSQELHLIYLKGAGWGPGGDSREDAQAYYQAGWGGGGGTLSLSAGSDWWFASQEAGALHAHGHTDQVTLWGNYHWGIWTASILGGGASQESAQTASAPLTTGSAHGGAQLGAMPLPGLGLAAGFTWIRTLWPASLRNTAFSWQAGGTYVLRRLSISAEVSRYDETGAVRRTDHRFVALLTRSFDDTF